MILLRCDLPVVGAGLGRRGGPRRSGRREFRNDFVDVAAAVADHKQDVDDSRRTCRNRRVQVDYHAARAV